MTTKSPSIPFTRVRKTKLAAAVAGSILATSLAPSAFAQELEEVMVTATKRSESVQDVPLAITAFSGNFTKDVNMDDVKDLVSFTPGVTGNSQDSFIDAISIRGVRTQDFGIGGDPSAAFFKNDLYEGRNGSAVTSMYDMERSEIMRGPQNFLFGRSAIGGAFSVHTNKAEVGGTDGYIDVDIGENGHRVVEGAQNIPVNDNFAMRFAGYYSHEDGVIDNLNGGDDLIGHEKGAFRWSTTFEKDQLSVQTYVEYEERNQSGSVYRAVTEGDQWDFISTYVGDLQNVNFGGEFDINQDFTSGDRDDAEILTLGLKIEYDFDFATLTSNTGYKDHDYFYTEDYDGTPLHMIDYGQDQTGDYFQQEFRLTSNTDSALSWYAGASYYKEEIETLFMLSGEEELFCQYFAYYAEYYEYVDSANIPISGCAEFSDAYGFDPASGFTASADGLLQENGTIKGKYTGWSVYANVTFQATDELELEAGIRHTYDEKDFDISVPTDADSWLHANEYSYSYGFTTDGFVENNADWSDTQLKALARYRPTDDAMYYLSYTEGYKSGGFGSYSLSDSSGTPIGYTSDSYGVSNATGHQGKLFDPETIDSWELGYKDTWFDGGADVSLSFFFYQYEDLQVVTATSAGAASIENVGEVDGKGIEATITAPISDNFSFFVALSWLDTEATELQDACGGLDICEGSSIFWAPEYSMAAVLNHKVFVDGGEFKGSLEVFGESERGGGWEGLKETEIDTQFESAFRYGYFADTGWNIGLYVENLTDEDGWDGQNNNGSFAPAHFFGPKRPRTFGLNLGYEWE